MKPTPSDNSTLSACCSALFITEGETTKYYVCTKCKKACDPLPSQQGESITNPSPQAGGCSPNTQNTAEVPPVGLSRRDEFAKAALTGLCAKYGTDGAENSAWNACLLADALIAELDK